MLVKTSVGETANETISFVLVECCKCGVPFMIPTRLQNRLADNHEGFYCPNGHAQYYSSKSPVEKLKDQIQQITKEKEAEKEILQNKLLDTISEKLKLEKQIKRVHKGVCPCCNRSFVNLQRHMQTQHPNTVKS